MKRVNKRVGESNKMPVAWRWAKTTTNEGTKWWHKSEPARIAGDDQENGSRIKRRAKRLSIDQQESCKEGAEKRLTSVGQGDNNEIPEGRKL